MRRFTLQREGDEFGRACRNPESGAVGKARPFLVGDDRRRIWTPRRRSATIWRMAPRGRIETLDAVRGVAVLLVFCVHFFRSYLAQFCGIAPNSVAVADIDGWGNIALYWLFRSHHGVLLFFVLSGFLIASIWRRPGTSYGWFICRRANRIYPAFVASMGFCALLLYTWQGQWPPAGRIFSNLFLMVTDPPVVFNNVSWSLWYEAVFYLSFPVSAWVLEATRWPAVPLFAVLGVIFCLAPIPTVVGEYFALFLMGAIVAHVDEYKPRPHAAAFSITLCCVVSSVALLLPPGGKMEIVVYGAAASFLLLNLVNLHDAPTAPWFVGLKALGRVSYSFYLLHSPAIAVSFAVLTGYASEAWRLPTLLGSSFSLAVVLATLSYFVLEAPRITWSFAVDLIVRPPKVRWSAIDRRHDVGSLRTRASVFGRRSRAPSSDGPD